MLHNYTSYFVPYEDEKSDLISNTHEIRGVCYFFLHPSWLPQDNQVVNYVIVLNKVIDIDRFILPGIQWLIIYFLSLWSILPPKKNLEKHSEGLTIVDKPI